MAKNESYELLQEVYKIAERLETKFDTKFTDHEQRLRSVEAFINKSTAIVSMIMLFVSAIVSYLVSKLTGSSR